MSRSAGESTPAGSSAPGTGASPATGGSTAPRGGQSPPRDQRAPDTALPPLTWSEHAANFLMIVMIGAIVVLFWPEPDRAETREPCGGREATAVTEPVTAVVRVPDSDEAIDVLVGRDLGRQDDVRGNPIVLPDEPRLAAGAVLRTTETDLRREDGVRLPRDQVTSWATVSADGTRVTLAVCVSPRYRGLASAGEYTGAVSLDDPRAAGASTAVTVHVQYPYLNRVVLWALGAGLIGLAWAWVIRHADLNNTESGGQDSWARMLALRWAALGTAIPIVVTTVVENPDWEGGIPEYTTLGLAVGAAVIAASPTFRALVSRVPRR